MEPMSRRRKDPEQGPRSVADLIAQYGSGGAGSSESTGGRRRRRTEDPEDTAPQVIIDRIQADSGTHRQVTDYPPQGPAAVPPPRPGSRSRTGETSGSHNLPGPPPGQQSSRPIGGSGRRARREIDQTDELPRISDRQGDPRSSGSLVAPPMQPGRPGVPPRPGSPPPGRTTTPPGGPPGVGAERRDRGAERRERERAERERVERERAERAERERAERERIERERAERERAERERIERERAERERAERERIERERAERERAERERAERERAERERIERERVERERAERERRAGSGPGEPLPSRRRGRDEVAGRPGPPAPGRPGPPTRVEPHDSFGRSRVEPHDSYGRALLDQADTQFHERLDPEAYGRDRPGRGGLDYDPEHTVIVPPGRRPGPPADDWPPEPGDELYDAEHFDDGRYDGGRYDDGRYDGDRYDGDRYDSDRYDDGRSDDGRYDEDDEHLDEERRPIREWLITIAQLVAGGVAGAVLWLAFRWLWRSQPLIALVAAVLVTLIAVLLVRRIWRSNDVRTVVMTVLIGLFVTMSPAVLLLDL